MRTKELVYKMLTENTGTHFLDSGGDNGRMWQRNASKTMQDFENEPEQTFEYSKEFNEIYRTVSVFHFLTNDLELDEICNEFNSIQDDNDNWNCEADVYGVSFQAFDHLESYYDVDIQRTWNTCNGESDLSQTLQGSHLTINDQEYVLIQIHGGADVRGGYTWAKLFKCREYLDGMIHEYLREYMDSYEIMEELEYIEQMSDYLDENKIYKGKELEEIKELLTK
jgi:hypothetical protein